jgi:hypothetical protein
MAADLPKSEQGLLESEKDELFRFQRTSKLARFRMLRSTNCDQREEPFANQSRWLFSLTAPKLSLRIIKGMAGGTQRWL